MDKIKLVKKLGQYYLECFDITKTKLIIKKMPFGTFAEYCWDDNVITLNETHVLEDPIVEIIDSIQHEICHKITDKVGHGHRFKSKLIEIKSRY